ncbi:polysaccharide biosynthesis tyrosine autokinase [Agreia sp. VKM Ac-1783]|uniref:polysaccharide biosynthesis tyrosine autokinase n=1 Tax=Agreia sp. VKM Ac-1783 TaxID=1938889 RepID=UPI000A2AECF6|nr:polysaccharide biosynthesis tyrosine autokinase [Agreia sp. VKM Ac-1783]SMQ58444.1 capsular exopolysaccharide family [Agreia sp. VKM Ac-1783]
MELRDYARILQKSWVLIAVLLFVGIGAAAGFSILQTPKYSSSAKVFVSTSGGSSVSDLQQGNTFSQQRVKTYADLATTPIVLLPVIAELGLDLSSADLAAMVTATAPLNTTLIEIGVTNVDPALASQIATAVSESLTKVVEKIETPADTGSTTSPVKLTLVQHAEVPQVPVSPNIPLNIALGGLVGLVLGIAIAVLREASDNRIRSERDVEAITDAPILGGIVFDSKAAERPLIVHDDPRSPRAESFRTLRTNLQYLDVGRESRSFVITSSIQSEGKSTSAVNLAIALADAGSRVLLVDADLRRPKIHEYLGLEGAVGLTDLLIGRAEPEDVIQPWGQRDLFVLPAGTIPPNPSELLGSDALLKLVSEFNRAFDVVLFDSAPLLPVTDAAILARTVGGTIVVCAAGRTHKNQLRGAFTALANVDAPVSGVVLTMLPTKGPDAYGHGRYGYGYTYGDALLPGEIASK